jgi:ABC-type transport system involved in multi-copper enzyme maturation permease subunit
MDMRFGLGPVFAYEWLRTSRRWQLYALRALFALLVAGGFLVVWWTKLAGRPLFIKDLAATGESFFYALIGTQLSLILLTAPAYTAGAICLDKSRGTLAHLLVTDLSNTELVLGKLAARLLPVLGLVGCAMPLLFAAMLLGGIDPESAIGACLVTLGTAVLGASLALALSVWARKTHEVLLATYILIAVVVLAHTMWLASFMALSMPPPSWLSALNPFELAFLPYLRPGSPWLDVQLVFLGVTVLLSAGLVFVAALRIRAVAMRQADGRRRRQFSRLSGWLHQLRLRLPGPALDRNPVCWRECRRQRPSGWVRRVWWFYALLSVLFTALAMSESKTAFRVLEIAPWVNALQIPIGLLLLSIAAVTGLAEERTTWSLELLLATPMPSRTILWGKWWSAYQPNLCLFLLPAALVWTTALPPEERSTRTLLAVGIVVALLAVVNRLALLRVLIAELVLLLSLAWYQDWLLDRNGWTRVLVMAGLVLAYGAAVTSLGLALATWIARQGRALALSVTLLTLVTVVPFLPFLILRPVGRDSPLVAFGYASPFFGPGWLTALTEIRASDLHWHCMTWNVIWTAVYFAAALVLFLLTLATFDRRLGRGGSTMRKPQFSPD